MMTQSQENGVRVTLRTGMITLVLQFLVLAAGIVFNYASTQSRLASVEEKLNQHIAQHKEFLRVDVWELRNKFIDAKLDRIEAKVDQLVAHDIERMRLVAK